MCEVCKAEGIDYRQRNGPRDIITIEHLYKVFRDSIAKVRMCYIHSIELFTLGERRFLKEHLPFAHSLAFKAKKISSSQSPFGF
jgi:hypothetical protein